MAFRVSGVPPVCFCPADSILAVASFVAFESRSRTEVVGLKFALVRPAVDLDCVGACVSGLDEEEVAITDHDSTVLRDIVAIQARDVNHEID